VLASVLAHEWVHHTHLLLNYALQSSLSRHSQCSILVCLFCRWQTHLNPAYVRSSEQEFSDWEIAVMILVSWCLRSLGRGLFVVCRITNGQHSR
jgi:hypothetical protein